MSDGLVQLRKGQKIPRHAWHEIKARVCAGESPKKIAAELGVSHQLILMRSKKEQWPTPIRVAKTARERVTDQIVTGKSKPPVTELEACADIWLQRKQNAREFVYQESHKALQRFFGMSPVPQNFQEAEIARKMMETSMAPEKINGQEVNMNLVVLTQAGFAPRRVQGRTVQI